MAAPVDPRLIKRATATRSFLVAVGVTGIVDGVLIVSQAWLIAKVVAGVFDSNSLAVPGPLGSVGAYLGALLAIFAVRAGLSWLTSVLGHRASAAVKSQLRVDLMRARLRRPHDASVTSSQLIHLVTQGLDALDGYFAKFLPQLMIAVFVPAGIWLVVFLTDWISGVIIAITIPLVIIFMILIGITTRDQVNKRLAAQTRLSNHFADLIAGLPTLQTFGRARGQAKGLQVTEDGARSATMKTLATAFLSGGVLEFIATISVALVAVNVGFRTVAGGFDLTTALFILVCTPEAYLPVRQVGTLFHDSADGTAAARAALDIIESAEVATGSAAATDLQDATITFDDVSVTYPGADSPALAGLSFTLSPGKILALVGTSGAGKSTALSVLMGFTTPSAGSVSVGGVSLNTLYPDSWRSRIAWVSQDPGMIRGDIASNIRLGSAAASDEQLRSALDRVGAADLALARPIADDGEGLSAGERRRVALARALVRIEAGGIDLLVLDEPTAGLDQHTEATVVELVRSMGLAVLVVTHREAMRNIADQVIDLSVAVTK